MRTLNFFTLITVFCLFTFLLPLEAKADRLFKTCDEILTQFQAERVRLNLSNDEAQWMSQLLPEFGGRTVFGAEPGVPRWTRNLDGHLQSIAPDGFGVEMRVVKGIEAPRRVPTEGALVQVLEVPEGFDWEKLPDKGRGLFRRTFLGHPLYPFLVDSDGPHQNERQALGERALVHREVQDHVINVGKTLLHQYDQTHHSEDQILLAVSPTGTGKSEIVRNLLSERLKKGRGLYILMSDQTTTVDQLTTEVTKIQSGIPGEPPINVKVIRWGENFPGRSGVKNFAELEALVDRSDEPVILITPAASFRTEVGGRNVKNPTTGEIEFEPDADQVAKLRSRIKYWVYDEGHRAGALQIGSMFEKSLKDNPDAAGLLITATPDDRVQRMANHQAFYTYLDKPATWLKNRGKASRTPGDVVEQLERAFLDGDLVGFDEVRPLLFAKKKGDPVFSVPDQPGQRTELLPEHFGSLYEQLRATLLKRSALMSVSSQRQALQLTEYFSRNLAADNRKVAIFTSDYMGYVVKEAGRLVVKKDPDILEKYKRGEIHLLISVDRLNEAIDLPIASCLIDLRNEANALALTQRIGRIVRTAKNKRDIEVFLAQTLDRTSLQQTLDELHHKSKPGSVSHRNPARAAVPIDDYIALIKQAGRIDFWNNPEANAALVTPENYPEFEPLLKTVADTFEARKDFPKILEHLKFNLPKKAHREWDNGVVEIFGKAPPSALLGHALAKRSPYNSSRVVRTLELYARLNAEPASESHFSDPTDYGRLLKPFQPFVTTENFHQFAPLLRAVSETFGASLDFNKAIQKLKSRLPETTHADWELGMKLIFNGETPSARLLGRAIPEKLEGNADRVVRVLELYARLNNIPVPATHFRDKTDYTALLKPFQPHVNGHNFSEFAALLNALRETFAASKDFTRVLHGLKSKIPEKAHKEWDTGVKTIFGDKAPTAKLLRDVLPEKNITAAEQVVRLLELYARLKGLLPSERNFRDEKDYVNLLQPFQPIVTDKNYAQFEPLVIALKETFSASQDFSKVTTAFRANLPQKAHEAWDQGLLDIFGTTSLKFSFGNVLSRKSAFVANRIVRTVELYAQLRGVPIPESHFVNPADLRALLSTGAK